MRRRLVSPQRPPPASFETQLRQLTRDGPIQAAFLEALGWGPEQQMLRQVNKATSAGLQRLPPPGPCRWVHFQFLGAGETLETHYTFGTEISNQIPYLAVDYDVFGPVSNPVLTPRPYTDQVCFPLMPIQAFLLSLHDLAIHAFHLIFYELQPPIDIDCFKLSLSMGNVRDPLRSLDVQEIQYHREGVRIEEPLRADLIRAGIKGVQINISYREDFLLAPPPNYRYVQIRIFWRENVYWGVSLREEENGLLRYSHHYDSTIVPWEQMEPVFQSIFLGPDPCDMLMSARVRDPDPNTDAVPGRFSFERHRGGQNAPFVGARVRVQVRHNFSGP